MSQESQGTNVMVIGRLVWLVGDLFTGRVKIDEETRQPVISTKTNQPVQEYGFGLAIPESAFANNAQGATDLWNALLKEAMGIFPNGSFPPDFAWKFKRPTDKDKNGVEYAQRKGYAGHLVFACTTQQPIRFYRFENGVNTQINNGIKCGDYVEVQLSIKGHASKGTRGKPGLYINPLMVRFNSWGEEIINIPSGDQVFGATAPVLAMGGSAAPIMNTTPMPSMMPQPGAPAPIPAPPQAPAQPHHAVLPQAFQPQQAPGMPAASMPGPGAPSAFQQPGQGFPGQQPMPSQYPQQPYGANMQPMQQGQPGNMYPSAPAAQMPGAPNASFTAPAAMPSPVGAPAVPGSPGGYASPQQFAPPAGYAAPGAMPTAYPSNPQQFPGGMPFPGQR